MAFLLLFTACINYVNLTTAKASLRAKDPAYRVDQVAGLFNGGGHACAAGLNVKGMTIPQFQDQLVAALAKQITAVDALKKSS